MAPKKGQQQKMSIGDFLSDQSLGSWADEMDNMPMPAPTGFGARTSSSSGAWQPSGRSAEAGAPSAGGFGDRPSRLTGYAVREELPLPDKPPYTAHMGNLSFEVTENDVQDFLSGCEVTSVRIVEDKMDHRPKGFGYVEFATVDGLKKALTLSESQFQGRNIRISVADPPKDREPQRTFDDWTRKGPLPDLPGQGGSMRGGPARGGSFRGGFDAGASDAGSERGGRKPFFEGDGKVRDFGNWERKGPLAPADPPRGGSGSVREGRPQGQADGGSFRERRQSPGWGEGTGRAEGAGRGSEAGSRPPRREFSDRPPPVERQPTAADMDNQWRTKMRPDAPTPPAASEASTPTSPAAPAAPATRPRLNLAKRTVSEAPGPDAASSSDSKASPFGAARPIDSTAREREIEEKRQLAIRQKKEQQDKEREERRASAAAAGKDSSSSSNNNKTEKVTSPSAEKPAAEVQPDADAKEADSESKEAAAPGQQYEILRRDEGADMDGDAQTADANGNIIGDKAVKPQEVTREVPSKAGGSWRKPAAEEGAAAAATTAETVEEEGWSTVSKKEKNFNRRGGGNAGSRAMAS